MNIIIVGHVYVVSVAFDGFALVGLSLFELMVFCMGGHYSLCMQFHLLLLVF